jgi:hypothetical protein
MVLLPAGADSHRRLASSPLTLLVLFLSRTLPGEIGSSSASSPSFHCRRTSSGEFFLLLGSSPFVPLYGLAVETLFA